MIYVICLGKPSKSLGQIHIFIKVWKKGVFCTFLIFARFWHFLTTKFPKIFHTLGAGGDLGGVKASLIIIQIVLVILLSETLMLDEVIFEKINCFKWNLKSRLSFSIRHLLYHAYWIDDSDSIHSIFTLI